MDDRGEDMAMYPDDDDTRDTLGLPEVLTIDEAARLFRVSTRTLQRWCLLGVIPTIGGPLGSGHVYRIPRRAVVKLLEHGREYNRPPDARDPSEPTPFTG